MQEELNQQIDGLKSPWQVAQIELDQVILEIRLKVEQPRGA